MQQSAADLPFLAQLTAEQPIEDHAGFVISEVRWAQ
jgi:hypothetical protein